jgi:hypothetical protein
MSSKNLGGSKELPIVEMASDSGVGHYFGFLIYRHLVLNIFPFPLSTAQARSRTKGKALPIPFRVPYVGLYYWHWDSYSTYRRDAAGEKRSANIPYWRSRKSTLSHLISAGCNDVPRL